jgi:hypothetical protein
VDLFLKGKILQSHVRLSDKLPFNYLSGKIKRRRKKDIDEKHFCTYTSNNGLGLENVTVVCVFLLHICFYHLDKNSENLS